MTESELRETIRAAVTEYEVHREKFPVDADDPAIGWWYEAWAENIVPVLKEWLAATIPSGGTVQADPTCGSPSQSPEAPLQALPGPG